MYVVPSSARSPSREIGIHDLLRRDDAGRRQERLGQAGRDDQVFAVARDRDVVQLGVGDDGQVGGQRPGRRRPDDERGALVAQPRVGLAEIADDREADVDRRRGVVLVFDLRLGQRGAVGEAPVDRLLVAVDEPRLRTNPASWRAIVAS